MYVILTLWKKISLFDMKVFTSISCLHVSRKVEWIHNRDFALEYSTRIKPQKSKSAKLKTCVTLTKTLILEQKSNVIYVWQFETRNSNSIQSELDLAALPNSLQLKKNIDFGLAALYSKISHVFKIKTYVLKYAVHYIQLYSYPIVHRTTMYTTNCLDSCLL